MSKYSIQIGKVDGYRSIGIQPPLDRDQYDLVAGRLGRDIIVEAIGNGRALSTTQPFKGSAYTELVLTHDLNDRDEVRAHDIAFQVGLLLEQAGHIVDLDQELHGIGNGRHLFGGEDRMLV